MTVLLTQLSIWRDLQAHAKTLKGSDIKTLFQNPLRSDKMRAQGAGLSFDYAKNRLDDHTLRLLFELAEERFIPQRREALFNGKVVNVSENRAALHVALRAVAQEAVFYHQRNVVPDVEAVLEQMTQFVETLWDGEFRGATGKSIRTIINIGIGGSYLGPQMAYQALRHYRNKRLDIRFLANIDGAEFEAVTEDADPAETLFIVSSKTFTTLETMTNAQTARQWIVTALGEEAVPHHFVAVSTNRESVAAFGVSEKQTFGFWDWVGGRYSMDSAIGLSTMIAIGSSRFREMLGGFHAMDQHFLTAAPADNLPFLHGLIAIWNNNFLHTETLAILPYAHDLRRLPAYLQQLFMESNGKRVNNQGKQIDFDSCPIVWGEPGTDGQHSFYQLLHQGTRLVACDFIGFLQPLSENVHHHDILMASLFAQSEALAFGKSAAELAAEGVPEAQILHRVCPGNRPSNILLAEALTPASLGSLIAFYEHSVFVQGAIWDIDSFDQWGVELGKHLAQRILEELHAGQVDSSRHDAATSAAIAAYLKSRGA